VTRGKADFKGDETQQGRLPKKKSQRLPAGSWDCSYVQRRLTPGTFLWGGGGGGGGGLTSPFVKTGIPSPSLVKEEGHAS